MNGQGKKRGAGGKRGVGVVYAHRTNPIEGTRRCGPDLFPKVGVL